MRTKAQVAEIRSAVKEGLQKEIPYSVIAHRLDINPNYIRVVAAKLRRADPELGSFQRKRSSWVQLSSPTWKKLKVEADKRNITVKMLMQLLLHLIATDNLFRAVLDDEKPNTP